MINEYTYIIGMTVISNLIGVFLLFGMAYISACKKIVNDEKTNDVTRKGAEMILEMFHDGNVTAKIVMILQYGALLTSVIFRDITTKILKLFKEDK